MNQCLGDMSENLYGITDSPLFEDYMSHNEVVLLPPIYVKDLWTSYLVEESFGEPLTQADITQFLVTFTNTSDRFCPTLVVKILGHFFVKNLGYKEAHLSGGNTELKSYYSLIENKIVSSREEIKFEQPALKPMIPEHILERAEPVPENLEHPSDLDIPSDDDVSAMDKSANKMLFNPNLSSTKKDVPKPVTHEQLSDQGVLGTLINASDIPFNQGVELSYNLIVFSIRTLIKSYETTSRAFEKYLQSGLFLRGFELNKMVFSDQAYYHLKAFWMNCCAKKPLITLILLQCGGPHQGASNSMKTFLSKHAYHYGMRLPDYVQAFANHHGQSYDTMWKIVLEPLRRSCQSFEKRLDEYSSWYKRSDHVMRFLAPYIRIIDDSYFTNLSAKNNLFAFQVLVGVFIEIGKISEEGKDLIINFKRSDLSEVQRRVIKCILARLSAVVEVMIRSKPTENKELEDEIQNQLANYQHLPKLDQKIQPKLAETTGIVRKAFDQTEKANAGLEDHPTLYDPDEGSYY